MNKQKTGNDHNSQQIDTDNAATTKISNDKTAMTVLNHDENDATVLQNQDEIKTPTQIVDVGTVIRKRFVLEKKLGQGGMGAVFSALDLVKQDANDNNPHIAIKVLSGDFQQHPQAFITLQREAKKTQQLAHPNIVTVFDFDRVDNLIYLTMEQLQGSPLDEVLKFAPKDSSNLKNRLDFIEQIARGLAYAHSKGIVHSDLKPENIFLNDGGVIKILDFGIARAVHDGLYQDTFDAGELGAMTLIYASPEMIRQEPPHPSDDIYALGVIACRVLGGHHPFGRKDAVTAIKAGLIPKLPKIRNPFLRKCILQSLALERKDRIKDANVFLKKFKNAQAAPLRIVLTCCLLLLAGVLNTLYISTIKVESVPFDSLPQEKQTAFYQFLQEGNQALRFQDFDGAVVYFNSAFAIHETHKDMLAAQEKIIDIMQNRLKQATDPATKANVRAQIKQLQQYPAFAEATFE